MSLNLNSKVVHVFPLVYIEAFLVGLVSYAISNSPTKHALGTLHVVVHYVLKVWLKSFFVNQIEVDVVLSGNLDSDITSDEEDKTSDFNGVILDPTTCFSDFIKFLLEEKNKARRSDDQSLSIYENHLTEFIITHLFVSKSLQLIWIDSESLTLSIENIDLILFLTIEALLWEILVGSLHFMRDSSISKASASGVS